MIWTLFVILIPAITLTIFNLNRIARSILAGIVAAILFYLCINLTSLTLSSMYPEFGWLFLLTSIRGIFWSVLLGIIYLYSRLIQ